MIRLATLEAVLGPFIPDAAGAAYRKFPPLPPAAIEAAARRAAAMAGRTLDGSYAHGPAEARVGDRSFAWQLSGSPGLVVKVLGTSERATYKSWLRAVDIARSLRTPPGLRSPRIYHAGLEPVPWFVEERAPGPAASPACLSPAHAVEIISAIQGTRLSRGPALKRWNARRYRRQILEPTKQLLRSGVITPLAARQVVELARTHLPRTKSFAPVLSHNDLAISHIYPDGGTTWLIDWESPHYDRLLMVDAAHLMVNHGPMNVEWASRIGRAALDHLQERTDADLRSNLVVALLDRVVGKAYEWLRRYRLQSRDALEALCALIDGDLVPR